MTNANENKRPRENESDTDVEKKTTLPLVDESITGSVQASAATTASVENDSCSLDKTKKLKGSVVDTDRTTDVVMDGTNSHSSTIPFMSCAPSVQAYLQQKVSLPTTDGGAPGMKYLPRPEWFGLVKHLMRTELENVLNIFNFDLTNVLDMTFTDYNKHLIKCVTANRYDLDLESEDYAADDEYKLFLQECVDFLAMNLRSNMIYFDINAYNWKTQWIQIDNSNNTIRTTKADLDIDHDSTTLLSSPEEHKSQVTYSELVQRRQPVVLDSDGNTILHRAIQENATDVAMDIIRIEYNTFLYCHHHSREIKKRYENPIFMLMGNLNYEHKLLHLDKTMLEQANYWGYTPLVIAAQKGNIKIIRELLRCGVSLLTPVFSRVTLGYSTSVVHQAAHYGRVEVIKCIIEFYELNYDASLTEHRWPMTLVCLLDKSDSNQTTPLMRAAQEGHISTVKLLLEYKASVNTQNKKGMTALMFAAQRGHLHICQLLINNKADLDVETDESSTALLLACTRGHVAVVQKLLAAGCDIRLLKYKRISTQFMIQRRIERRLVAPEVRPVFHQVESHRSDQSLQDDDDGGDESDDLHFIPICTYQKIVQMLHPQHQVELMQFSVRCVRNFEILRIYELLQQNRANIKFTNGTTYNVPSALNQLSTMTTNATDQMIAISPTFPEYPQHQLSIAVHSTQMLIRTMLLPAPIIQKVALFLPLPSLWHKRIVRLDVWTDSHCEQDEAIFYALDIIDEILDEAGFLLACDTAHIPAPSPHQTWLDWKLSAKPRTSWIDRDVDGSHLSNRTTQHQLNIVELSPPSPNDEKNPTISELRRSVGYLSLLKQYSLHTNITTILSEKPYEIPCQIIEQLIRINDVASICRRCFTEPKFVPSTSESAKPLIRFDSSVAKNILNLTFELVLWYKERENLQ